GFALEKLQELLPALSDVQAKECDCPIQQGLANENPDVDAIYRLILPLPLNFEGDVRIALGNKTWCPFNSQNTTWFREAFPLMYLPSYCSFRMTDIWRSFIAQRIAWENNWSILFHPATVWQERNMHNLMRDFSDEIPGYTNNLKIAEMLENLDLKSGVQQLGANLHRCYEAMVGLKLVDAREIPLLEAWLHDIHM
ncbi:MAG TPA: STELLO glycosyltransferase family protein, partial [Bacteroidia bacterium]|nr:STELLO glycosyltransferase family protein [Bacteroidia bacterium]